MRNQLLPIALFCLAGAVVFHSLSGNDRFGLGSGRTADLILDRKTGTACIFRAFGEIVCRDFAGGSRVYDEKGEHCESPAKIVGGLCVRPTPNPFDQFDAEGEARTRQ